MGLAASLVRCFRFPRCLVLRAAGAGFGWLSSVLCGFCSLSVVRRWASCWVCCWWLRGAVLGVGLRLLSCFGGAVCWASAVGVWRCASCCGVAGVCACGGASVLSLCLFPAVLLLLLLVVRWWCFGAAPSGWGVSSGVMVAAVPAVRASGFVCLLFGGSAVGRAAVGLVVVAVLLVASAGGASVGALLRLVLSGSRAVVLVLSGAGAVDRFRWWCWLCCAGVRWSAGCWWCFGAVAAGWLLLAVGSVLFSVNRKKEVKSNLRK